ncbi:hypothetical protein FB45DRAFT_555792 [Roridomyces roridus]|uniref:Uncharacterized protein n=1 Tax=Roridomyces roridus TaxID=1738132 RepID=A0AAD7FNZ9_9AGAR|nr:hypothetical protein FB45DRAFT_555792 [Roridomyces roridus]
MDCLSFYLQTFFLVILVDRSWPDAPIALWTFIATSGGLTISAIVEQSNGQLTLFQGLQVSNLVWLANFGTFVALASYSRQKAASHKEPNLRIGADYNVKFGAMVQTIVSMALTIYMWSTSDTFGSLPQCSHLINYMVFAIKLPALGAGKIVGLTASVILTVSYILLTLHELRSYRRTRKETIKEPVLPLSPVHKVMSTSTSVPTVHLPTRSATLAFDPTPWQLASTPLPHSPKEQTHKRRPRRRRWSYEVDPMLIGIMICQMLVFIYFVASSELLLLYNNGAYDSAEQMGFGQILALIVVLPSALSVVGALREHGLKRLSKRKKLRKRTFLVTENV